MRSCYVGQVSLEPRGHGPLGPLAVALQQGNAGLHLIEHRSLRMARETGLGSARGLLQIPLPGEEKGAPGPRHRRRPRCHGHGREEDIELLWDIQRKIEGNTICPLGDAAAWPVAAAIRHFRDEFEYHVRFPEKIKNRDHFVAEPFEKVKHLVAKEVV